MACIVVATTMMGMVVGNVLKRCVRSGDCAAVVHGSLGLQTGVDSSSIHGSHASCSGDNIIEILPDACLYLSNQPPSHLTRSMSSIVPTIQERAVPST